MLGGLSVDYSDVFDIAKDAERILSEMRKKAWPDMDTHEAAAAVCGLGTIGMMVLMLLIGAGYKRIFVIGNKDGQRIRAVTAGLCPECFCDIREADPVEWLRERTDADGIDLYFECVGKMLP